ncbi:hypothetical protein LCGC14_2104160, partial [marine sediment metagenome]
VASDMKVENPIISDITPIRLISMIVRRFGLNTILSPPLC